MITDLHGDLRPVWAGHQDAYVGVHRQAWPGWNLQFLADGRMEFGAEEQAPATVARPAIFWTLPGRRYRLRSLDRRGWDHHWVTLAGSRAAAILGALDRAFPAGWCPVRRPAVAHRIFHVLIHLARRYGPLDPLHTSVEIDRLLVLIAEDHRAADPLPHAAALERLAGRIADQPTRAWDLVIEAGRIGLSVPHFRRLFQRTFGCPPHRFILRARLQVARHLLATCPGLSVAAVAERAGFTDVRHFSRSFQAEFACVPSRARGTPG